MVCDPLAGNKAVLTKYGDVPRAGLTIIIQELKRVIFTGRFFPLYFFSYFLYSLPNLSCTQTETDLGNIFHTAPLRRPFMVFNNDFR